MTRCGFKTDNSLGYLKTFGAGKTHDANAATTGRSGLSNDGILVNELLKI